jgi:hypothetical protein
MNTYQVSVFKDGVSHVLETFKAHSSNERLNHWLGVYPEHFVDVYMTSRGPIWTGNRYTEY